MAPQLEIEFKNILTKSEFSQVKQYFKFENKHFVKQKNYYFDTEKFYFKNNNSALRIREKNDTYELTLKQPAPVGLYETNEIITENQFHQMVNKGVVPDGKIKSIIENDIQLKNTINYFGNLTTLRAETEYQNGLIVLDKSTYLNTVDYELEYEVSDVKVGKINFLKFLEKLAIPIRKTDNKIQRFYNQKQQLSSFNGCE